MPIEGGGDFGKAGVESGVTDPQMVNKPGCSDHTYMIDRSPRLLSPVANVTEDSF